MKVAKARPLSLTMRASSVTSDVIMLMLISCTSRLPLISSRTCQQFFYLSIVWSFKAFGSIFKYFNLQLLWIKSSFWLIAASLWWVWTYKFKPLRRFNSSVICFWVFYVFSSPFYLVDVLNHFSFLYAWKNFLIIEDETGSVSSSCLWSSTLLSTLWCDFP